MSPKTRQALTLATAAVALASVGGIAAILGWLPDWTSTETPSEGTPVATATPGLRIAGTAPPESLSPGETIIDTEKVSPPPAVEQKGPVAAPTKPVAPPRHCTNCGRVASLTYHPRDPKGAAWEVTVIFDDGTRLAMRYPTNPGFKVGERVSFNSGRLQRA